jgi:inosose dehydratase
MSPRIAGAPISWGVSEVRGWGHRMRRERVLGEMRELGLTASEAGPDGFLPDDPSELRELLADYDMTLASGFTPLVLHREWRDRLEAVAHRFAAAGADVIVLAASTELDDYDCRPRLSNADWDRLLRALDQARELAADRGLEVALHPHFGTAPQTPEEIEIAGAAP